MTDPKTVLDVGELREQIARIVDPWAWAVRQRIAQRPEAPNWTAASALLNRELGQRDEASLEKADAILSLAAQALLEGREREGASSRGTTTSEPREAAIDRTGALPSADAPTETPVLAGWVSASCEEERCFCGAPA